VLKERALQSVTATTLFLFKLDEGKNNVKACYFLLNTRQ
jgi:hypothetical protein